MKGWTGGVLSRIVSSTSFMSLGSLGRILNLTIQRELSILLPASGGGCTQTVSICFWMNPFKNIAQQSLQASGVSPVLKGVPIAALLLKGDVSSFSDFTHWDE